MQRAGLWRGTAVTLVRDWPSFGVYFAVYEGMQEVLQPGSRASKEISPLALITAGGHDLLTCTHSGPTWWAHKPTCMNNKHGAIPFHVLSTIFLLSQSKHGLSQPTQQEMLSTAQTVFDSRPDA